MFGPKEGVELPTCTNLNVTVLDLGAFAHTLGLHPCSMLHVGDHAELVKSPYSGPLQLMEAIQSSQYYTSEPEKADIVFVNDYCYYASGEAFRLVCFKHSPEPDCHLCHCHPTPTPILIRKQRALSRCRIRLRISPRRRGKQNSSPSTQGLESSRAQHFERMLSSISKAQPMSKTLSTPDGLQESNVTEGGRVMVRGPNMVDAYQALLQSPRWQRHMGADFVFYDSHAGFGVNGSGIPIDDLICSDFRNATFLTTVSHLAVKGMWGPGHHVCPLQGHCSAEIVTLCKGIESKISKAY